MDLVFFGLFFWSFLPFLGPLSQHMEVPRQGVESELQLPAYTTATAAWDLSWIQAVSPPYTTARGNAGFSTYETGQDQARILMDPSRVC